MTDCELTSEVERPKMTEQVSHEAAYHDRRAQQERHLAVIGACHEARRAHAMLSKLHRMMWYDLTAHG